MNDEKMLTFNDILLVPQYSTLKSRSEANTTSVIGKGDAAIQLQLPIIAAPMDTVCGEDMLVAMALEGGVGILHRYMSIWEQVDLVARARLRLQTKHGILKPNIGAAIGATDDYLNRFAKLVANGANLICIDVAHGHHVSVKEALEKINEHPLRKEVHIMAGNIATAAGFKDLSNWGADSIRLGVGGGCFLPNTPVLTESGYKNICDIQIGDYVIGHSGKFEMVEDTLSFFVNEEVYNIDGIECTGNHEFFVVDLKNEHLVTKDNINDFAYWIRAKDIDKDKHLLVEI